MDLLGNINPANMLSNAAESFCDALLPKELEFIGDLAGLAVDYQSGNWLKAIEDFQDLAQDLPQQLEQLANKQSGPGGPGGPDDALITPSFLEAAPPPPYAASNSSQTSSTTTTTTTTVTTNTTGTPANSSTAPSTAHSSTPSTPPEPLGPALRPRFTSFESALGGVASRLPHLALQPPFSQPLAAPIVRGTQASSPTPPSSSVGTTQATPAPTQSAPAEATTSAQGTSSPDEFFKLSDTDLMNAVRDGKIPAEVSSDPKQMQRLQLRMNQITEMNQMITSMLKALHDMNSQVIQNIRV